MKKGRIWLIVLAAGVALSAILWIARPKEDIWRTQYIWVEDASGRVQGTITDKKAIRTIIRQVSRPSEEPWADISGMEPTAQLEFITPENGYGPMYYYQQYDICVPAQGEWVVVPRDFFDYVCQ